MKKLNIYWSLFLPYQSKAVLTDIAENIDYISINTYKMIQSMIFGVLCSIISIFFINFINTLVPLYIDRGGYSWIAIYQRISFIIPFLAFLMGILLVNINYYFLYLFSFIKQVSDPICYGVYKKAILIGYADLSSTLIISFLLITVAISKKQSIFDYFISKNMDQYCAQEQIILTFYKPIVYLILFLLFKTVIQLNSARKSAIILNYLKPEKNGFLKYLKLSLIPMFIKKAFLITICLIALVFCIYFSQNLTAEFITIK